ncbi:hypothetical protein JQ574_15395 [Bradyrhizobium sp. AUGA SZCCT0158]|uniref:hypothetical protein n=1 Tax=Bradyrhizobium sp. AUGA SZCCT0158 TaxID=2807661 RepID=UPI001BA9636E|nr:hypothetical protein [Bradyrhizobium sp. AUGA SZCCT0158]MBR1197385.1 hypothetical protein [Bradyrhizobium sp. AUGA SZCCT0158]
MKKLVTAAAISFFALGSSLALAQTAPPMIAKDSSKTGATPPNAGASASIAVDPKAKKPTPMSGPDYQHKAGAAPPNAGASASVAVDPKAKKPVPMSGPDYQHKAGAAPPNAGASAPIASAPAAKGKK